MLAMKFQKYCLSKKLLRPPFDLSRKLCVNGRDGDGNFSKTIPKLFYLHNPLTFLWTRFQLARIRFLWDREFELNEFYRGTKKSATVMTDCIREQDELRIGHFTTPIGYQQIIGDMLLSRRDARLQLLRFRVKDIHRAIPLKVVPFKGGSNRSCFIDMLFVGMRNTKDFQDPEERRLIGETLDRLEKQLDIRPNMKTTQNRILFAEIYMRFFRNYTPRVPGDWSVSFYKIVSFHVLNFM